LPWRQTQRHRPPRGRSPATTAILPK
jgi:hypothetical protein